MGNDCELLEDLENALEVYNALNDSDYKDPSQVEMNCLEMGVLLSKCKVLREYMIFVDKIRGKLAKEISIDEAIDQAINECINENILRKFLIKRGNEVRQVAALDYTWEAREGMIRLAVQSDSLEEFRAELGKLLK